MTKKIFAMFLAVLMVISLLPTSVFAANECPGSGKHTLNNCDYTVVKVTEPTCGEDGFTTYQCKKCKETFAESVVSATGEHTWVDAKDVAPTCGTAGSTGGKQCSVCGKIVGGTTIAPVYEEGTACEWVAQNEDVDCTTGGTIVYECAHCGAPKKVKVDKVGDAHAWNYSKMSVKVEATATEPGIVVIPCGNENCPATKEIKWFADHSCTESVEFHKAIADTCTTDGEIAHWECRVCGKLYGGDEEAVNLKKVYTANEEVKYNGIVIKAGHTKPADFVASCSDQTVKCAVCSTKFTVAGKHDLQGVGTTVAATCTTKGYTTQQCSRCKLPVVTEIPALGHVEVTISVPATCGTYAYTFTACMRDGCVKALDKDGKTTIWTETYTDTDNGGLTYDVTIDRAVATTPVAGVAYKLSLVQKTLGMTLYMNSTNKPYNTSSEKMSEGQTFYVEAYKDIKGNVVEGAYRLYYYYGNSTTPSYVYATKVSGKVQTKYINTVANGDDYYWTWNAEYGVLTAEVEDEVYFLCAYDSYNTFGLSNISYITSETTYAAVLTYDTSNGIRLVDIDIDVQGGFDATKHNVATSIDPATCYGEGTIYRYCSNPGCTWSESEVIDKVDHKWNALGIELTTGYIYSAVLKDDADEYAADLMKIYQKLGLTIDGNKVDQLAKLFTANTCTTTGSYIAECAYCHDVQKRTIAAAGHYYNYNTVYHQDGSHVSNEYDYYACSRTGCTERKKFNVTAWDGATKNWDDLAAAKAAHGDNLTLVGTVSNGDCTTVGLTKYYCTVCKNYVFVKRTNTVKVTINGVKEEITYTTGSHYAMIPDENGVLTHVTEISKDPTCQAEGWTLTYYCPICDKTIGEGKAGDKTPVAKAAHSFTVEISKIDATTNPCPDAKAYQCKWCDAVKGDLGMNTIVSNSNALCTQYAYEIYMCSCGEEHIRGLYGKFGHEWINYTVDEESTHTTNGSAHYSCAFCGEIYPVTLDKTPHVNAAGEEFTEKCTDTVTDRHCVLCCKCTLKGDDHDCYERDKYGNPICDCLIDSKCHFTKVKAYKDSTCTMKPYYIQICDDCGEQYVTVSSKFFVDQTVETKDGKVVITDNYSTVDFMGHKPAEVDKDEDGNELRYANYTYVEGYVYKWYVWEEVEIKVVDSTAAAGWKTTTELRLVEKKSEAYTAKFVKYVAPTYAEDGVAEMYCQICKANVSQTLEKKTGLGFTMDIVNANGQNGFGFGSLIEVTVNADSLKESVYGFSFGVKTDSKLVFVDYENVNSDFVLNVSTPATAQKQGYVAVEGFAVNSAAGKTQNIAITEKTALVKLYFRVTANNNKTTDYSFAFTNASASILDNATAKEVAHTAYNYTNTSIKVRGFLDFNGDGYATVADLYTAMTMLTGENPNGLTYDVTVDMNKDGEVTLEDLSIAYGYFVGNYTSEDLLKLNVSAEELAVLKLGKVYECNSTKCDYTSSVEFTYCPKCGNHQ